MPRAETRLDSVIHVRVSKDTKEQLLAVIRQKGLPSLSILIQGWAAWWLENNPPKEEAK